MGSSARDNLNPMDAVRKVTTRVSTELLLRNGIQNLRILSESQLRAHLEAIGAEARDMVRSTVEAVAPAGVDTAALPEGASTLSREKWAQLRSRHEESLRRIEGRMEKLSAAFHGIQGVFARLQSSAAPQDPARAPAPKSVPDETEKQKALLRQLLLSGDETK
jgi:hypothetical protein